MKNRHYSAAILPAILAAMVLVFSPTAVSAQSTLYWYPAAAPNQGGTGTWTDSASVWSESAGATKTVPSSAPADGDSVVFAGTSGTVQLWATGLDGKHFDKFEVNTNNYVFAVRNFITFGINSFEGSGLSTATIENAANVSPTLVIHQNTAFNGTIKDGSNSMNFTKTGAARLDLSDATLTYTGLTTINGGSLWLSKAQVATAANGGLANTIRMGNVANEGGTVVVIGDGGTSTINRSLAAGGFQVGTTANANDGTIGGFGARNGNLNINFGGAAASISWGNASFRAQTFIFGTADSTHTVSLANAISLTADGRILQVNNGGASIDADVTGAISTSSAGRILTTEGNGVLRLSGTSSNTVRLNQTAGTLLIDGSWSSTADNSNYGIQVASGAVLGGDGTISMANAPLNVSGTLMGGRGLLGSANQSLTLNGTVNFLSNSTLAFGLGATASDQIIRTGGTWSFQSLQQVRLFDMGADTITYTLISGLASTVDVSGWTLVNSGLLFGTFSSDASNVYFTLDVIPEPSSALLMALGMGALYFVRRRRI
jgi:autotransporter-associated beta strand protein